MQQRVQQEQALAAQRSFSEQQLQQQRAAQEAQLRAQQEVQFARTLGALFVCAHCATGHAAARGRVSLHREKKKNANDLTPPQAMRQQQAYQQQMLMQQHMQQQQQQYAMMQRQAMMPPPAQLVGVPGQMMAPMPYGHPGAAYGAGQPGSIEVVIKVARVRGSACWA